MYTLRYINHNKYTVKFIKLFYVKNIQLEIMVLVIQSDQRWIWSNQPLVRF